MQIHECARCEGCGYVTGSFRWEIPWSRWASATDPAEMEGVLNAQPCPDCGGTGALIRMDSANVPDLKLASRRGLRRERSYAAHVESVLLAQRSTKH